MKKQQDPKEQELDRRLVENFNWAAIEGHGQNECVCACCDFTFYAYSKFFIDSSYALLSKNPCPRCGSYRLRASYGVREKFSL